MSYSEMSDWEINYKAFLLGVRQGLFDFEDIMSRLNPDRSAVMYGDGANWFEWDGCNDASDAWPIIFDNKITISSSGGEWMANNFTPSLLGRFNVQFHNYNKNPLRAAMIVFLMMNEQES